jgi:hypothetical protein
MPELDPFEARLAAAVHAFADRAETDVDAMAVAERAIGTRRTRGRLGWIWASVPVPVAVLITLGLLVGLLAWSVSVGSQHRDPRSFVVSPTPTPTATVAPTATATPVPTTDGQGDEYVMGTATVTLTTPTSETVVGDATQIRGGIMTIEAPMNDPRVSGTATFAFGADLYPAAIGPDWGSFRLENAEGAWVGTCRGAGWQGGDLGAMACWLAGSGAYAGYTYYLQATSTGDSLDMLRLDGLIYPGSAPAVQGED